jgi:hypothetical protein
LLAAAVFREASTWPQPAQAPIAARSQQEQIPLLHIIFFHFLQYPFRQRIQLLRKINNQRQLLIS